MQDNYVLEDNYVLDKQSDGPVTAGDGSSLFGAKFSLTVAQTWCQEIHWIGIEELAYIITYML